MSLASRYDELCEWAYGNARWRLAPAVRNSHYAYRDALRTALMTSHGRWLDIGCGHALLPSWMSDRTLDLSGWDVIGVDLDDSSIRRHQGLRWRVVANVEKLPFQDRSFDLVTANMVVEHVADPQSLFADLARVLAPGGRLIVHTPNAEGYTTRLTRLIPQAFLASVAGLLLGRTAEDVYPTYYRANSQQALERVARAEALALTSVDFVNSSPQLVRVPPLMLLELLALRLMQIENLARHRACILATFEKPTKERHTRT